MFATIHRSILRELTITFLLSVAFLNSMLMMEKILRLSRLLSGVGASLPDMGMIILFIQPQILPLTIPMSLLLSALITYGRMSHDSEIVVLKASGMSFPRLALPAALLGGACFVLSIAVTFWAGPKSSTLLRSTLTRIITVRSTLSIEEGAFNTAFKDLVIIVKNRHSPDTLGSIFIYDNRNKKEPKVLMAKEGRFFVQEGLQIGLALSDGYINITRDETTTELFFDRYVMTLDLGSGSPTPRKTEYTPAELSRKIAEESAGKRRLSLILELHRRLSLPAVCLVLVILGPPLALLSGRSGRLGGLAVGLLVFSLYYMILTYGENLVMAGRLHHVPGAWAATLILAIPGIAFFRKGDRL